MSDSVLSKLQSAYEAYQLNPNVAKQIVAATANGQQPPSIQGLAAAAALQAPQAPVQPPQGTVIQHLAAQQGIAGQIPNAIGLVPQGAPQAPAQPQMPPQGMAAGGLVSFMHGGDVQGYYGGRNVQLDGIYQEEPLASEYPFRGEGVAGLEAGYSPTYEDIQKMKLDKIKAEIAADDAARAKATESTTDATGLHSLDKSVPEVKFDYGLSAVKKATPHIEKASVHPEAKKTDSSFKKASIDTSSTALQDKAQAVLDNPTATKAAITQGMISDMAPEETIAYMQKLAGGPRQLSPEMMAKLEKGVTGAKEDKWLGALMGLLGGTLSSSSPYLGQAVGEGGLKALSAYQQGSKEQGAAEQALMSAQLGQEDAQRASQQAAFEQYMKTQQAKMNAQAELAKAGIGAKTRWDLLQENLAFKASHPEIYSKTPQRGTVEQKDLSAMLANAEQATKDEIADLTRTGTTVSEAQKAAIRDKNMRTHLGEYYSQVAGSLGGGSGYSPYGANISRIIQ